MTTHKVGGGSGKPRACLTPAEAWLDTLRADLTHWQEVCYAHEAELQCFRAENARLRAALSGLMEGASAEEGWWTLIRAHSSTLDAARAALSPGK